MDNKSGNLNLKILSVHVHLIIVASNILLLASKKCFLTSQGLVGADMNCRALHIHSVITSSYNTANSYELTLWKGTSIELQYVFICT
jgi:hypothetical protein